MQMGGITPPAIELRGHDDDDTVDDDMDGDVDCDDADCASLPACGCPEDEFENHEEEE